MLTHTFTKRIEGKTNQNKKNRQKHLIKEKRSKKCILPLNHGSADYESKQKQPVDYVIQRKNQKKEELLTKPK